MARRAGTEDDDDLLNRIAKYVCWAAAQTDNELQSAVDLAFFLRIFRDPELLDLFKGHIPNELIAQESRQLFDEPTEPLS